MSARRRLSVAASGLVVCVVAVSAHAAATADTRPQPGLYKVTSTVAGERPRVSEECLGASDLAEVFRLSPGEGKCAIARQTVGGGRIDMAQTCTSGKRVSAGAVSGSYSMSGYQLRIQSRAPELPKPLDARISAQRIGTCSAD